MPFIDHQGLSLEGSASAGAPRPSGVRWRLGSVVGLILGATLYLASLLIHPQPGEAQAPTPTPTPAVTAPQANPAFVMEPWSEATDDPYRRFVRRGRWSEANDNAWPGTFHFTGLGGGICLSNAVGPKAVLTAAHCVADGAVGQIQMYGWTSFAACRRYPPYEGYPFPAHAAIPTPASPPVAPPAEPDGSADFALCLAQGELLCRTSVGSCTPAAGLFERVHESYADLQLTPPPIDITVQGWGCDVSGFGNFNTMYLINGSIADLPHTLGSFHTTTKISLCDGDSGGGAFISVNGNRRLFGVNSEVSGEGLSRLATTSFTKTNYDGFVAWARQWGSEQGAWICGLHPQAEGCRP